MNLQFLLWALRFTQTCLFRRVLRTGNPTPLATAPLLLFLFGTPAAVFAQTPGVTESEILIGSCSALEGPSHFLGQQTVTGAKAYFSLTNDEGGVNGRKLKLVSVDDSYDPAKTQACFDHLMSEKVFALGFFVGTPTAIKYVPLAESNKIPLIGLFTGAQTLYTPFRHWVVTVRASYFDETREQVDGLWKTLGYKKNRCHLSGRRLRRGRARRRQNRAEGT
jgi:branched-chain amino acid transport system substrate-binding protein